MDIDYTVENTHGILGLPDGEGPFPAVLAVDGSDGGTPRYFADLLVPEDAHAFRWPIGRLQRLGSGLPTFHSRRIDGALRWLIDRPETKTDEGRVEVAGAGSWP